MTEFIALLHELESSRFYGSLELKYEAGKIVLVRKSETLKPIESSGTNRSLSNVHKPQH